MVPSLKHPLLKPPPTIEWRRESAAIDYGIALDVMRERGDEIARGDADELVWLLEHEAIYTAGTSTRAEHVPNIAGVPVISVERGGSVTYHGPGQLIAYTLLVFGAGPMAMSARSSRFLRHG